MKRRSFVSACVGLAAAIVARPSNAMAATMSARVPAREGDPHPTPRPGITSAKVTSPDIVAKHPSVEDAFEAVRAIPEIADGLRCHCGCATLPGFYSLLTCFEGPGAMALSCPICPGEGRMAARLHKSGMSLKDIRAALDAKYG